MNKLSWLFLLLLSFSFKFEAPASQFHAILLLDHQARQIECVVEANQQKMDDLVEKIALYTQLNLNKYLLKAEELDLSQFYTFLENLNIGPDDLVFFYFSGHGFRTLSKEGNPWPNLYLTQHHKGLDFKEIVEAISEKNPRLLFALADCCNNLIPEKHAPPLQGRAAAAALMRLKPLALLDEGEKYKRLFLHFQGRILISSAYQGEYSWGTKNGGIYTLGLLDSLNEGNPHECSWESIIEQASLRVVEHQNPYSSLEIYPLE